MPNPPNRTWQHFNSKSLDFTSEIQGFLPKRNAGDGLRAVPQNEAKTEVSHPLAPSLRELAKIFDF